MQDLFDIYNKPRWWQQVGVLRWLVALLALVSVPCAFMQNMMFAEPWDIIIRSIMPGVALFLIWAIPLDLIMAKVFQSDGKETSYQRYRIVIRFDLLIWLMILLAWGYFFLSVMQQRLV